MAVAIAYLHVSARSLAHDTGVPDGPLAVTLMIVHLAVAAGLVTLALRTRSRAEFQVGSSGARGSTSSVAQASGSADQAFGDRGGSADQGGMGDEQSDGGRALPEEHRANESPR